MNDNLSAYVVGVIGVRAERFGLHRTFGYRGLRSL